MRKKWHNHWNELLHDLLFGMIFTAQRIGTQGFLTWQTLIISICPLTIPGWGGGWPCWGWWCQGGGRGWCWEWWCGGGGRWWYWGGEEEEEEEEEEDRSQDPRVCTHCVGNSRCSSAASSSTSSSATFRNINHHPFHPPPQHDHPQHHYLPPSQHHHPPPHLLQHHPPPPHLPDLIAWIFRTYPHCFHHLLFLIWRGDTWGGFWLGWQNVIPVPRPVSRPVSSKNLSRVMILLPVVPHKAVAEVSKMENL